MKKIYAFLLTALAISSAPYAFAENTISRSQQKEALNMQLRKALPAQESAMKAPARATSYDSYSWESLGTGTTVMHALADTYSSKTDYEVEIFEAVGHEGVYKVVGLWPDMINDGTLIIDATDPTYVTIPKQDTGIEDSVDGETYIASASVVLLEYGYTEDIIRGESSYVITLEDGVINMPSTSVLLQWPEAPSDSKYETDPTGWYYAGDEASYIVLPGGNFTEPWQTLEDATFNENILYPLFVGEENSVAMEANARRSNSDPTQYRIYNPLAATYAALGIETESPYMDLDASDPDNIQVGLTSAGIYSSSDGNYYYFSEAWYNASYGEGADATEDDLRIKLAEDGEYMTITFPYHCMTALGMSSGQFYYGSPYESVLKFKNPDASVNGICSESDGEAVYYNLQGARVANPENGIVIRLLNGKATKVLVK